MSKATASRLDASFFFLRLCKTTAITIPEMSARTTTTATITPAPPPPPPPSVPVFPTVLIVVGVGAPIGVHVFGSRVVDIWGVDTMFGSDVVESPGAGMTDGLEVVLVGIVED